MSDRRRRSEMLDGRVALIREIHAHLPQDPATARERLAALLARWEIPQSPDVRKDRATPEEMAERCALVWWIIDDAKRRVPSLQ